MVLDENAQWLPWHSADRAGRPQGAAHTDPARSLPSIVWRSDLTAGDLTVEGADKLEAILELVPPRSAETIEVPIWAVAAWLRRWNTARAACLADVPERADDLAVEASETNRPAFRWAGADDPRVHAEG